MIRPNRRVATQFHLREATAEDEAFRYRLFIATIGAEFMKLVGDESLLQIQYRARRISYEMSFPGAEERVICLPDGKPVGRLLIYLQPGAMRLVDIGLLESYRGQGIGTTVLRSLQQECRDKGTRLELQVAQTNRAANLYLQMGFTVVSQDAMYAQMRWQPTRGAG
jgi:ribosomal protein S18 acetylase RimI-like enzyme